MTHLNIDVHHVTRIEGHGNIIVNAKDGAIEEVRWEVPEAPRFFEAMMRGLHYHDVNYVVPRICGICSLAHNTASIEATEAAFGIQPSEQTLLLRKLLFHAETLQSHVLHACFLVAPDLLNVGSVIPLAESHTEVVVRALRLKKFSNDLADVIAGRKIHPLTTVTGGFTKFPDESALKAIRPRLLEAMEDLDRMVELFKSLEMPDFVRETEYIALKRPDEYAFIGGDIASTDTGSTPPENYLEITNEYCVPHSTAKFTRHNRDSYMVGAIARFNLNHSQLLPKAAETAVQLGLTAPCHNPFMNTMIQMVECVHVAEDALAILDHLIARGVKNEKPIEKVQAGRGVGVVEAPRGLLIHDYTFDENGYLVEANCVIPTNQNHMNIQKDFEALLPGIVNRPEGEVKLLLEMLVRAYDPCVSCSTH